MASPSPSAGAIFAMTRARPLSVRDRLEGEDLTGLHEFVASERRPGCTAEAGDQLSMGADHGAACEPTMLNALKRPVEPAMRRHPQGALRGMS